MVAVPLPFRKNGAMLLQPGNRLFRRTAVGVQVGRLAVFCGNAQVDDGANHHVFGNVEGSAQRFLAVGAQPAGA